uniref:Uncharacterized protein n=1 Tax=Siphoviridae sp. ctwhn18 TaxID=2825733 RepID=A0A8S5NYI2_9CAUD|nr:MAG TPA: hypothetical protein [Siphoviridae sp. ctwhn18]DAG37977.1 MAG TPA: hypothetical protein [Caudoviricetes sp.]
MVCWYAHFLINSHASQKQVFKNVRAFLNR